MVIAYLRTLGATNIKTTQIRKEESEIQADVPGESQRVTIEIHAHGSATAFRDLIAAKADVGMASRKIESREREDALAAGLGDMTSQVSEHVIGLDGLAVIVNRANPIQSLTTAQIARIFSGDIADWSDVMGKPGPIKIYARDQNSGTWDTFKSLVLKDRPLRSDATRLEDSKELSNRVADDEQAIGFIGLPYILNAKSIAVFETQHQGRNTTPLYPTVFTVQTEEYPLTRRLYFYYPQSPTLWARKFVAFALSRPGQAVVADTKFVSLTPCTNCEQPRTETEVPERYTMLTRDRVRISLNFFFRSGSADLDNRAAADIDRVLELLHDLNYSGSGIVLMGFADNVGSAEANKALSGKRAQSVAEQFISRGIHPEVLEPMGSLKPIASNDSPTGREKNRRVEIWVKKG
jgi:phosphate transport system substrate-binding protein